MQPATCNQRYAICGMQLLVKVTGQNLNSKLERENTVFENLKVVSNSIVSFKVIKQNFENITLNNSLLMFNKL